jgi:hypothetical protein
MKVSFKGSTTLSLLISRIGRRLFFISITIIPCRSMFTPRSHTNPAEFVGTFPARHVVTTAILFNGRIASGTFFGVGRDPIRGFGIVFAFLEPFFDEGAGAGLMVSEGTAKAETVATAAMDGGDNVVELRGRDVTFDGVFAVRCGTPLEVVIIVDVCSVQ